MKTSVFAIAAFLLWFSFTNTSFTQDQPSLQTYSKFDFIPGEIVILFDDFSQDNVGNFPALWFSNGSGEVVTLNNFPGKWLQLTSEGCYYPLRQTIARLTKR